MTSEINKAFKERVAKRDAILLPGAGNALTARVIADMDFEAVYLSGAGLTNMALGMPDLSFINLTDICQTASAIRNATDLPIIVDADTGFGNALNVWHSVRMLERAGATVVQLEDQLFPKRCGHFEGKALIEMDEMVEKIKAAVDARQDKNMQIMARTDARAITGFENAVERARAYVAAGADLIFVEAPENLDEVRALPKLIDAPHLINIVVGGKTPVLPFEELERLGYSMILYANAALQGAVLGMQTALGELQKKGFLDEQAPVASFKERQRLVQKPLYDEIAAKYSGAG